MHCLIGIARDEIVPENISGEFGGCDVIRKEYPSQFPQMFFSMVTSKDTLSQQISTTSNL